MQIESETQKDEVSKNFYFQTQEEKTNMSNWYEEVMLKVPKMSVNQDSE